MRNKRVSRSGSRNGPLGIISKSLTYALGSSLFHAMARPPPTRSWLTARVESAAPRQSTRQGFKNVHYMNRSPDLFGPYCMNVFQSSSVDGASALPPKYFARKYSVAAQNRML